MNRKLVSVYVASTWIAGCGGAEFFGLGPLADAGAVDASPEPARDVEVLVDGGEVLVDDRAPDVEVLVDAGVPTDEAQPVSTDAAPDAKAARCTGAASCAAGACVPIYEAPCCLPSGACGCMTVVPSEGACR